MGMGWYRNGNDFMGMGGNGNSKVIPAHLYFGSLTLQAQNKLLLYLNDFDDSKFSLMPRFSAHCCVENRDQPVEDILV